MVDLSVEASPPLIFCLAFLALPVPGSSDIFDYMSVFVPVGCPASSVVFRLRWSCRAFARVGAGNHDACYLST